ncbi:UDP-glucose 4-epimerase [Marinibactrum halimedae]|uniref:UDP-glucose 4-epimerase n=1 Tax=Marinibactrum halimedae TaxID=1444977 RepID=A0AA37T8K5_9GAMM|nr:UDP-glucose 4-epimerase [Marinibactrum halimedae]
MRLSRHDAPGLIKVDYTSPQLFEYLTTTDTVIHLAGVAHNPNASGADYYHGNVTLTQRLITACLKANVKRIVYISSIKAMGEQTRKNQPFTETSPCHPEDDYGKTKLAAERLIQQTGKLIEWVIVRPPLVLGDKPSGNLKSLEKLIQMGVPLPLGNIRNRRSMVSIKALIQLLGWAAKSPCAAQQVLLPTDQPTTSTTELIQSLSTHLNTHDRLFNLPQYLQLWLGNSKKLNGMFRKLFGNLEIDNTRTQTLIQTSSPIDHQPT